MEQTQGRGSRYREHQTLGVVCGGGTGRATGCQPCHAETRIRESGCRDDVGEIIDVGIIITLIVAAAVVVAVVANDSHVSHILYKCCTFYASVIYLSVYE